MAIKSVSIRMGDVPIKTLTTHRLEKFYRQLLKEPAVKMKGREQEERTISFSVVEKVHSILRSALNQAIRWDYLRGANPAMAVELPRHKKHRRDAWTDQEAYEALALCTDPVLKLCLYLALGCSMRIWRDSGAYLELRPHGRGTACPGRGLRLRGERTPPL